ncbi:unnamed protein product [Didymodactylos carnosus]|uniref:TIR domain-containing protein n=1 Tax=Didymodactylos carnosus TaxID=1234261 RepID=A0A816DEE4_9BILA|nr:unnamed protein product [Didymodactylos carnosus]CAF1633292.1 unnamed protein product [Didymodactylos carnosus]CAF4174446.1 unnamed protein product [Didymodactylos carnosus]CAF4535422.1 unnamed protein product [Didymodactylos carnosus]
MKQENLDHCSVVLFKIDPQLILEYSAGFVSLSKNDSMQQKAADANIIPLLIEMCDEYPMTFDILWALSFNTDIQQQLRSNKSFMVKLAHLEEDSGNQQMRKITNGILWNLESNHKERATSETNDVMMFDIMISYSHKDKVLCKQLYEELARAGYRVWIDFDQMHGNVMDAMAQAIERSRAIIICISEEYRRSNYCRAEAHYAFQRQLRIVPVLLQKSYKPDGWLLFLIGQLLYVDFTKNEFPRAMEILVKELKALVIPETYVARVQPKKDTDTVRPVAPVSPTPSPSLILPDNILEWTQIHVQDWLIGHNLVQMSRLLANCDGSSLIYLNEFIKNCEPQQVLKLLQEDSVRRTKESLSLVELACFRSGIDRQKQ